MTPPLPRRALLAGGLGAAAAALAAPRLPRAQPRPRLLGYPAWLDAWEAVLRRRVDAQGRVDFAGLAAEPGPLEAVVAEVEAAGPGNQPAAFPTRADVLAVHINAYYATAMLGIVRRGVPTALSLIGRYQFFANTAVRVGGALTTLKAYEDGVIRPLGEERAHFALNCMVRGCPRLPREAFRAPRLEEQLAAAAREFCESPYQVRPDPAVRTVRVSQIFDFYTADFVPARAPTLIAYINRWRREPIPADWTLRFFDYDWTVNRQPSADAAGAAAAAG